MRTPRGILAPSFWYFFGFFRKSTNSWRSCFSSAEPATSLNIILPFAGSYRFALFFEKPIGPPPDPAIIRPMRRIKSPTKSNVPIIVGAKSAQKWSEVVSIIDIGVVSGWLISIPISLRESFAGRVAVSVGSASCGLMPKFGTDEVSGVAWIRVPTIVWSRTSTFEYLAALYESTNWEIVTSFELSRLPTI